MKKQKPHIIARFLSVVFALVFALSAFSFVNTKATEAVFKVQNASISELSNDVTGEVINYDDGSIESGVRFYHRGDSAKYNIELKNTDSKSHKIISISDESSNPYIEYTYDAHENHELAAGESFNFELLATYANAVEDLNNRDQRVSIKLIITYEEAQDEIDINPDESPDTGDKIGLNVVLMIVSAIGLLVCVFISRGDAKSKKKPVLGLIIALSLALTAATNAVAVLSDEVLLSIGFGLYDKIIVNLDGQSITVDYDDVKDVIDAIEPTKTGYNFDGWQKQDGSDYSAEDKITGDVEMTSKWSPIAYTLEFQKGSEGSPSGTMEAVNAKYDESVILPECVFENTGWHFVGWEIEGETYEAGAEVKNLTTEDGETITAVAKWSKRTDIAYIVRHSYENLMDDNYTNEDIPMQGSVDTDITPERKPKTGYVTPAAKTERIKADGSSIITYQYDLERKELALDNAEFIENGSSAAGEYKYGYPISLTAKNRESHNFLGWSDGDSIVSQSQTYEFNITKSVTLSPSYEIKKFTVTVDRGDSTPEVHNDIEYGTELSTILGEAPIKTGYHFVNWTSGDEEVTGSDTVTSAMDIIANFEPNNYNVVFHKNDGGETEETAQQQMTYDQTTALTKNAFDWPGYRFVGWATSRDGEVMYEDEEQVSNLTATTDNVDLYAVWELRKFTVVIDPGNGESSTTFNDIGYGTSLSEILPSPTKTGYHFVGWTDQDSHEITGEDKVVSAMTITGHFDANTYTVAFNPNTGSGSMEDQEFTYDDEAVALRKNSFERPGYKFVGWSTTAGGDAEYADEALIRNLTSENGATVNLYAKWDLRTDIPYTVYHRYENIGEGFEETSSSETGSVDMGITPETVPREGFQDAVADSSTPVPGQIDADGDSFFIYYYYRLRKQLTINDSEHVSTDTPTGEYKYGAELTVTAVDREGYEFSGWSKDGGETIVSADATYSFTITEDTTLTPVYEEVQFYYVFNHPGACRINSGAEITGDDCQEFAGQTYIDTGVKLYDEEDYNLDYEIGFTLKTIGDSQVQQATYLNAKLEDPSTGNPGLVSRRSSTGNLEIAHTVDGAKEMKTANISNGAAIKILRVDGEIYYSINGGGLIRLQSVRGTSDYHDITTWFGASYNASTDSAWRYFNGEISNMYIKKGIYDGDKVTISFDANGGSVEPESVIIPTGLTLSSLPIPSYDDKSFIGWYEELSWQHHVTASTVFTENKTIHAYWTDAQGACEVNGEIKDNLTECVSAAEAIGTRDNPGIVTILRNSIEVDLTVHAGKYVYFDGRGFTLSSKSDRPIIESFGTTTIENTRFVTTASQAAVNARGGTLEIHGGEIIVNSNGAKCRQGVYVENSTATIDDGTMIHSICSQRAAIGIDSGTIKVVDATVISERSSVIDGSRVAGLGNIIIGNPDEEIESSTPTLRSDASGSGSSGIKLGNKTLSFYDGQLYSKGATLSGGSVTNTEPNAVPQNIPLDSDYSTYNWLYYTNQ